MRQFKMNGRQITGFQCFRANFTPEDLLRQREDAAGFLYQQARFLSDAAGYHCEMFYQAVFNWAYCVGFPMTGPEEYFEAAGPVSHLSGYGEREIEALMCREETECLLTRLWQLALETDLEPEQRPQLYCLLAAGYFLADKTLESCPLTAREAALAFRREQSARQDQGAHFGGEGDILLTARREPYRVELGCTDGRLPRGKRICLRRILALPHEQSEKLPVVLELYRPGEADWAARCEIRPGDYRYCNTVDGVLVHIHPVEDSSGSARLERLGNVLRFTSGDGRQSLLPCGGEQIVGFALEQEDEGWILLEPDRVDYHNYSERLLYEDCLPETDIVQVQFRRSVCLLLDSWGRVRSNAREIAGRDVAALEYFRFEKEEENGHA